MIEFEFIPGKRDPRWKVLSLQMAFILCGISWWGFNRSPLQIGFILLICTSLDMLLHFLLRRRSLLFPLSAMITGMGLSILSNFSHGLWLAAIPPFFAIASKYVCTVNGRHVYNPALFGVVASLLLSDGMITPAPAYQWGGSGVTAFFIATTAMMLFALNVRRNVLIISFLVFYSLQLGFRAWLLRHHIPPQTLLLGAFSSPAFYLFTFFMITDPRTSPESKSGQIWMAFVIVFVDLLLHKYQAFSTLFYAGFIYFTGRWLWLLWRKKTTPWRQTLRQQALSVALIAAIGFGGWGVYRLSYPLQEIAQVPFTLVEIPSSDSGLSGKPSDLLARTDPRMVHVAKWLLSIGDAAAVADVNNDGLPDIFLTQPLKDASERAQLYLNQGEFRFTRFPLPMLESNRRYPENYGLISSATWFDMDNDGDRDLLLGVGFGNGRLLRNEWIETGKLAFSDISHEAGIDDYQISVSTNVLDMDQDGLLDLIVGNVMERYLPSYDPPVKYNIFDLPMPEYEGDRRMFNVMHRSWHDANNADMNPVYRNLGAGKFSALDLEKSGFVGKRWTMAIGTGDLNADGWPDIYYANDFGPDELYINYQGRYFQLISGALSGQISRDSYKGMNATFGDIDENGRPDIYVSNVHEKLQAEGSLLWMNFTRQMQVSPHDFKDQATQYNALNEHRFGWGAAFGDMDRDGRLDIVQANGMADDAYDKVETPCPDYWYWNAQIALTNPDVHGYADRWADVRGRCIFGDEVNRLYWNRGNHFIDVAKEVGWQKAGTSRGMILADFDNDGDLDNLTTHMTAPPSLYRNDSQTRNWIGVDLVGNGKRCNRDALGSQVILPGRGEMLNQHREVYANNGLSAQNDHRLLFGLGERKDSRVRLRIRWCGQQPEQIIELATGQYHTIYQQ